MKKNWTMRVALLIVALALITSCFVSGTYAKYITSADADDTARVAKFGVVITSSGSLFDKTYKRATDNGPGGDATTGLTVVSEDTAKLVAPGTKNADGITFTVTGKPEVNVAVSMTLGEDLKEVFLKAGTYADMTTAADDDTFTLADDYYPVVFTLKVGTGSTAKTYTGTLADIKAALDDTTSGAFASEYAAGTDLSTAIGTISLTWEWAFGNTNVPANGNDFADTLLGDLAAGTTILPTANAPAATNYNLSEVVDISLNIVQVD